MILVVEVKNTSNISLKIVYLDKISVMSIFNTKKALVESGIFEGYTDFHSHFLPGVDDGIQTMEDSLKALHYYEILGVRSIWCTPHIMEDMPNTTDHLREVFDRLTKEYTGKIELRLASENMLDNLFQKRFEENDFLPIGNNLNHLLVETSYYNPPIDLWGTLKKIMSKGYYPILAHPERYVYMDMKEYERLRSMGVRLQLDIMSLSGGYGKEVREKAYKLILKDYYDYTGTDIHRLSQAVHSFNSRSVKKSVFKKLKEMYLK